MIVNSEVGTLESNLGTMIINDTDDDDNEESAAAENSETMKRMSRVLCVCLLMSVFALMLQCDFSSLFKRLLL